jgi:hypothetical protein
MNVVNIALKRHHTKPSEITHIENSEKLLFAPKIKNNPIPIVKTH